MVIKPRKFQQGGAMDAPVEDPAMEQAAPEASAPEQGGGQDPMMLLAQMAALALQSQDPNLAFLVCQALLKLIQAAQGGGAGEQPVFKKGGKISRYVKR